MTVDVDITDRLLVVLRTAAGAPDLEYGRSPEPMRGGFWAELLSFSLADPPDGWSAELVARLMPDPVSARKETIVQRAVAEAGFPTPAVRASGGPGDGLGRAFMVMDRAAGGQPLSGLDSELTPAVVLRVLRQVPGLLGALVRFAGELGRPDLAEAGRWLEGHPPRPAPDVICHGDLHPFNLLADGNQVTVLDWSTALLAPRAHDVGYTTLLLSEPPLSVPSWQRPLVRGFGRLLARRFVRDYQRQAAVTVEPGELSWHQAVICLRALVEVAAWVYEDTAGAHAGHPWLVSGPAFAHRLAALTGISVRSR